MSFLVKGLGPEKRGARAMSLRVNGWPPEKRGLTLYRTPANGDLADKRGALARVVLNGLPEADLERTLATRPLNGILDTGVIVLPEEVRPKVRKGAGAFFAFFLNSLNLRSVLTVFSLRSVSSNSCAWAEPANHNRPINSNKDIVKWRFKKRFCQRFAIKSTNSIYFYDSSAF